MNNELTDLRNQISFIAGGDVARDDDADGAFAETLGIGSPQGNYPRGAKRFHHLGQTATGRTQDPRTHRGSLAATFSSCSTG